MLNMWPFKTNKLENALYDLRSVKIMGIDFTLKKIDVFDHMSGSNSLKAEYDVYKVAENETDAKNRNLEKKMKIHYRDVLCAGIVVPFITRKKEDSGTHVDELFKNWELADRLYEEIIDFTYGKKKVKQRNLPGME